MSYVYNLLFLAAIIVPPLLVTLAVVVDLRSRRGFGLALAALAMLGYCLWRIVPTEQALLQAPASKPTLFQIALFFDFLICGYFTLLVWIGTVVEVSMARQMRWLAALIAEVVLAVLVVPAALLLHLEAPLFTFLGGAEALLVLLLPMVTALAYGVVRSATPTPRLEPEMAPGGLIPAAAGEVPQQSGGMRPQPAAPYQGSVIAVGILSAIVFLSISLVIVLGRRGSGWHADSTTAHDAAPDDRFGRWRVGSSPEHARPRRPCAGPGPMAPTPGAGAVRADAMLSVAHSSIWAWRTGGGHSPQQRPYVFLKASCCAASANAWRGRGRCRLCLRRTR